MPRARLLRVQAWPRLTRRGGTLLVVGVLLLVLSLWFDLRDILLLAFVGIAMPVAALAFVALRVPRVAVQRTFDPPVVPAGAWATVRLVVQNRSRNPCSSRCTPADAAISMPSSNRRSGGSPGSRRACVCAALPESVVSTSRRASGSPRCSSSRTMSSPRRAVAAQFTRRSGSP